jgi:hypothetical protein
MTDRSKSARMRSEGSAPSKQSEAPKSVRPSHRKVLENLDRWVNSHELQPPKLPDSKSA